MGTTLANLKSRLTRYTPKQLIAAGLLVAVVLGGSLGLYRWMTAPTMDVLFSGLSATDAAAIVDAVKASGTPYALLQSGDKNTVMVPAADVAQLRLTLASQNLPGDSVAGYELLDNQGVTVSTFREQVNYQRALEGELARTLMSMDSISAASVHIVLPRDRLYTENQAPASASVTLTTTGTLDRAAVTAITHLVASSVPDLTPGNVTITDATGQLLSESGDSVAGTSSTEADAEDAYATRLEDRAASMLAAVVGPDKAVVRVQADLDFTKRTTQEELFDPKQSAVGNEKGESEKYTSTTPANGGILTTNPGSTQPTNGTNKYQHRTSEKNFQVSRKVTSATDAPGAVKRMTVSVLIDPTAAGKTTPAQIQALVENAVGFDTTRGDKIAVALLPFQPTPAIPVDPAIAQAKAEARTKLIVGSVIGGVLAFAVLILAFFLLRGRRDKGAGRKRRKGGKGGDVDQDTPVGADPAGYLSGTAPAQTSPLAMPGQGREADRLLEQIGERPADAAGVLSGLLASDTVNPS